MSAKTGLAISRDFKRTDPSLVGGHPMRGQFQTKIQRAHLLRQDDDERRRERIARIRDTVISVMGVVSALIPLMIAFQSVTGA